MGPSRGKAPSAKSSSKRRPPKAIESSSTNDAASSGAAAAADTKVERRRQRHVAFEKRRREDLKVCFERLASVTPGCSVDMITSSSRPYKCHIVLKTIEHLKNLEAQVSELNARLAASNAQLHALGLDSTLPPLPDARPTASITELPDDQPHSVNH